MTRQNLSPTYSLFPPPPIPTFSSTCAGYVPLPAIVKKVVSDHAGSSLGEFRHVILAMLETYSYDTAIHR